MACLLIAYDRVLEVCRYPTAEYPLYNFHTARKPSPQNRNNTQAGHGRHMVQGRFDPSTGGEAIWK